MKASDMESAMKWLSATIENHKYKTAIITDTHTFIADEPVDNGGTDLAPSPGDYLRTSLASCTAITLRMYADRKKLSVNNIEVKVATEIVQGKTIFHRKIAINGEIDEAQRTRMMQIADLCPIHKILEGSIKVTTELEIADTF